MSGAAGRDGMVWSSNDEEGNSEALSETTSTIDAGAGAGADESSESLSTRDNDTGGKSNFDGDDAWSAGRQLEVGISDSGGIGSSNPDSRGVDEGVRDVGSRHAWI